MESFKLFFLIESSQIVLLHSNVNKVFLFDENELVGGLVFNQTRVLKVIKSYLLQNKLTNLPAVVVFAKSIVREQLVFQKEHRFSPSGDLYVKTNLNESKYYLASIDSGLVFQYQLLFWHMKIYIEMYTTNLVLHVKKWQNLDKNCFENINNLDELHQTAVIDDKSLYDEVMKIMEF